VRYLVQWIHHVADILKVNRMIHRIDRQACSVLETYLASDPTAGCEPLALGKDDGEAQVVRPKSTGYVQLIDAAQLHALACKHDLVVELCVQEGDFVHPHRRLMRLRGAGLDEGLQTALRAVVVIGFERSHEGDPRLGFELLAEVACRALSPGINDPQSALACIHHLGGLLAVAGAKAPAEYPPLETPDGRVTFRRCGFDALLERAFRPIIRDGAGCAEVILAIIDILHELAQDAAPVYLESVRGEAERAVAFGREKLVLQADRDALERRWEALQETAEGRT
jgi:uncharacterized membrane protein